MDWLWALIFVGIALFSTYAKARNAGFIAEEAEEEPSQKPNPSVKQKKKKKEKEYFTYETSNEPLVKQAKEDSMNVVNNEPTGTEENQSVNFDLRQAVIYNTILQNDYISDLK